MTTEPKAAGLRAFSVDLARLVPDDLAQLDAGMVLYDALYHWARSETEADTGGRAAA